MRTIVITPPDNNSANFRATIGEQEFVGKTAGEALDALASVVEDKQNETVYILQRCRPDEFFGASQLQRLAQLMEKLRAAEAEDKQLTPNERVELERLIDDELEASGNRAAKMFAEQNSGIK